MKRLLTLSFTGICFLASAFAAAPQELNSKITDVTVYLQGARISREARVNIPKGTAVLAFRELPENIDAQSIQVKGEGNFVILSIVHQVNYLEGQQKTAQVKMLEDSLQIYEEQFALVISMKSVLNLEEKMLIANQDIGSTEKGVVLTELRQAADFFRSRMSEIKKEEIKLDRQAKEIKEKTDRIKNQLNALDVRFKRPTSEVLVHVSSEQNVSGKLLVSYTVFEAGWVPAYDVRAKDIQSPVNLFYNARVFQHSGEPWDQVKITLSTANPGQQGEKPDLQPWYLDYEQPVVIQRQYNYAIPEAAEMAITADQEVLEMKSSATPATYTTVIENQTNLEFNITLPYDIPSDNKMYTINIQEFSLPAVYEYYCAPKLDREAFLLARITGWEDYNLLSGEMNLFFEDTYVGKSQLNVRNTKDTLDLSLGRDKGIIVTRVKLKDFTEQKTIGNNKRETRTWEITVRNNKKQAVELRIEDQLPISMNKDIEIEPLEYSGGKYNRETGLITWKQRFEPSAEKKLRVSFAVKYPKDKVVYVD